MDTTPTTPQDGSPQSTGLTHKSLTATILAIAIPSLAALIAEPLFILVDTAIVGRLGTSELAGLALASTVLTTTVGLCIFLAYATTATVARHLGAGRRTTALSAGIDGLWLAATLGALLTLTLILTAPQLLTILGAHGDVLTHASTYLRWSAPGLPGMLIVMAATGVLRGFQNATTPMWVAGAGAALNAALSFTLVWILGMGIAGSGLGTAITQILMAIALTIPVATLARRHNAALRPGTTGILHSLASGAPLFLRTLSLRAAIILTIITATSLGTVPLAGHQVINSLWGFAAFALDALAIAAQTLIGHRLGAADRTGTRHILRVTLWWGTLSGAVIGALIILIAYTAAPLFTPDPTVQHAIQLAAIVAGITMPITGWVCVLDGVLIGAGDGRYLAGVGLINLAVYTPAVLTVYHLAPHGPTGLLWLWVAFAGVFMGVRALTTGWRIRTQAWMRIG